MNATSLYLILILFPLAGYIGNLFFFRTEKKGATFSSAMVLAGWLFSMTSWLAGFPFLEGKVHYGFVAGQLSWLIASLVLFVSGIVHAFSLRYLSGDLLFRKLFLRLSLVTLSLLLLSASNHFLLLFFFWMSSNYLLTRLMIHKKSWKAAFRSGMVAGKSFLMEGIFLGIGLSLIGMDSSSFFIEEAVVQPHSLLSYSGIFFLLLAAMVQSGIWPFHRWLLSSCNAPTPISALMHAGLINGGGILLVRFSPMLMEMPLLLTGITLAGGITLIVGTLYKLVQTDIKRMLASSTMGQMGFMIMQCGLALFPAAIAHLVWHGLFKSFLFLRAGSVIEQRRYPLQRVTLSTFLWSLSFSLLAGFSFTLAHGKWIPTMDTTLILTLFAMMAALQSSTSILSTGITLSNMATAIFFSFCAGYLYGFTVTFVEQLLYPAIGSYSHSLDPIHIMLVLFVFAVWMVCNLAAFSHLERSPFWKKGYVYLLNRSQPKEETLTTSREEYHWNRI